MTHTRLGVVSAETVIILRALDLKVNPDSPTDPHDDRIAAYADFSKPRELSASG